MKTGAFKYVGMVLVVILLSGCSPHQMYRTEYTKVCVGQTTDKADSECEKSAMQQLRTSDGTDYFLGFIEFDDQGQLWSRSQMNSVVDTLLEKSGSNDLLLVVFIHGWKHSAAPGDKNIDTFRGVLANLADAEALIARNTGKPKRHVAGIYIGWRGGSVPVQYLENITFWDRKNTAQKVGYGGVAEVLSRLEDIKSSKDSAVCREDGGVTNDFDCASNTRLVIVGHSFGGAIVHTALAQILENRFVQTTASPGIKADVKGFGNLVVLINPAFEANLFTPLSDMAAERPTYWESQSPVILILTSEADDATGKAFPAGRWFSTLFEKEHVHQRLNSTTGSLEEIDEHDANVSAVGHFKPYRTHRLYPRIARKREDVKATSSAKSLQMFVESSSEWQNDAPGKIISFGELQLERTKNSAARNPYLVTYVDRDLITGHNDIDDPRIIEFIKQLILISTHNQKQTKAIQESF